MEEKIFNKLKEFEKDGIKLREVASWAVWDDKDIKNPKIIEDNKEELNGKIVFVALNFGGKKRPNDWKDWQNFHGKGVGDQRLCKILSKPEFKGAYMTDLIKNLHNSKAKQAIKIFKTDETKRNEDIEFLFKEIELLGTENIEMYLFGADVAWLFVNFVMKHPNFKTLKQKIIKCQRIHHYSPLVTNFEKIATVQLGLAEPKKNENKWIYYPLWDCSKQQCPRWC